MKIDVDRPFRNLNGTLVLKDDGEPFVAREALLTACITGLPADAQTPGLGFRLYKLAQAIHDAPGELELTPEDAALLKTRAEQVGFPPLTVGQLSELLNG